MEIEFEEILKDTWKFDVSDYLPESIDPASYFRTSGDATLKMKRLMFDLFKMWCQAKALHRTLCDMKGDSKFLEFKWKDEGCPILQHKDPRYKRQYIKKDGQWHKIAIIMSKLPEGWSRNAQEAMLMKTPVIGSGIAGMGELLESGGQIICREIDSLCTLVDNLLIDEEQMKYMSLKGYRFAKSFTKEKFNREWIDLIETSISANKCSDMLKEIV